MIRNLTELYHDQLRDLISAETQLIEALPEMESLACDRRLRETFSIHCDETRKQIERLTRLFQSHGIPGSGEECQAMKGLIAEARSHVEKTEPGDLRDALLIASANRVEHYEIAAYGAARAFAECLGLDDDAKLLSESIEEEGEADRKLTEIATGGLFRSGVNESAAE
jgi:ferritin-like metal-binding protein YciE